jgi:hypothetical protein
MNLVKQKYILLTTRGKIEGNVVFIIKSNI